MTQTTTDATIVSTLSRFVMTPRRHLRAALTAWVLFQCVMLLAARQQPAKVTVKGVVRDARTDQPIAGAQVTLTSLTPPPSSSGAAKPPAITTNSDGEFSLDTDIPVFGGYRFSVGSNGYVRHETTLYLNPGETRSAMVVRMAQTASISGHISTTIGQPVAGIRVQIQRRHYNNSGAITFTTVATIQTNDLGDYRAYWVTPGRYYVSTPPNSLVDGGAFGFDNAVRQGINGMRENYPQTFFPGVADVSKAVAVELAPGTDVRGIDFTMPPQPRQYNIRGRVIDSRTGLSPAKAMIIQSTFSGWQSATTWYDGATGNFEIRSLPPGRYGLVARPGDPGSLPSNPVVGEPMAATAVTVVDSDIENLMLSIAPSPVITGRLSFDGQPPTAETMENVWVTLTAVSSSNPFLSLVPPVKASTDGTFRMNTPPEGDFRVSSELPGRYLKDVRFNNASVIDAPLRMPTAGNLEIVVSSSSGLITGRVLDEQSKPFAGAIVVAVPNTSRDRPELFKRFGITTGITGYFVMTGLTPGDYKVFAWEGLEANSFYDPEVLKKYEQRGTPVRIVEGSRENLDIKVIPAEAAP